MTDTLPPARPGTPPPPPAGPVPAGRPGAPAAVRSGDDALLEVVKGNARVAQVRLGSATVRIGRAPDNDLTLDDDGVSRRHAEVVFADGSYSIRDLGSSNGVFVDAKRVSSAALTSGCTVTLGRSELRFTWRRPEVAADARVALLDRCDVVAGFDHATKVAIAGRAVLRSFPRGAVVRAQGAAHTGLLIVADGRLDEVEVNEEGGERVLGSLGPGDWTGDGVMLAARAGGCALVAAADTTILELPEELLREFVAAKPDLTRSMIAGVQSRLKSGKVRVPGAAARPAAGGPAAPAEVVIVGSDARVTGARKKVEAAAAAGKSVLICGEAGTGRRLLARHFHRAGAGRDEAFVEVNLAELDAGQAGEAIFGAESPDVGATRSKSIGALEMVGAGTLLLTHADRLDAHSQVVLANYLRLGWFHRVHGQDAVRATARVVLIADGEEAEVATRLAPQLRQELGATASLPPLALRVKDIPPLAEHFAAAAARRHGKRLAGVSREALDRLVSYAGPGNVSELENVIERAAIVAPDGTAIAADLVFVVPPAKEVHRLNLLRHDGVRAFLSHPRVFAVATWVNLAFVGVVLAFTLVGAFKATGHPLADATTNPGMLVTWLVWFPALPLSALLLGRVWCGICPIAGFGELVAKVKRFSRPVPKIFKRLDFWMLLGAYLVVEYVEGVIEVDSRPGATAGFLLVILGLAALFTVLYERHAFCRYLCPLAGWLGAYATLAPFEVRGNKKICQTQCGQHTCYKGTDHTAGCPVFLYPASVTSNSECLMCGNCLKNCESRGVQVNVRPPVAELWQNSQPIQALSVFALVILAVMLMHGLNQVPWWKSVKEAIPFGPELKRFTIYAGLIASVLSAFAVAATLSAAASRERFGVNLTRYGVAFIPLALALHLNAMTRNVLRDGMATILAYLGKLRDALFRAVPMTAGIEVGDPFAPPVLIRFINALIVLGGIAATLLAIAMIARRVSREAVFARALPHLGLAVVLGALALHTATAVKPPKPAAPAPPPPVTAPAAPEPAPPSP